MKSEDVDSALVDAREDLRASVEGQIDVDVALSRAHDTIRARQPSVLVAAAVSPTATAGQQGWETKYGKKELPFPYSQDLSGIVTRVKGKRNSTRVALANSPKVASYLKAGSNLVERHLGISSPVVSGDDGRRKPFWSGLSFLSERAVQHEAERLGHPFLQLKGAGSYRATWATHDDYRNDLLAFLFHTMNYEPQYARELEAGSDWQAGNSTFVEAVDHAAYRELLAICRMPLFRLQLIMAAAAGPGEGIHEAISNSYAGALGPWKQIYESTIAARGYRLRKGITIEQFANMLAAITEGFALRQLGDPGAGIIGDEPGGNLVGMAVLGIMNSYLERVDEPSGLTLREEFERAP